MKVANPIDPQSELSVYVPRAVRLTGTGRSVVALAIGLAAAGLVIPVLMGVDRERKTQLRERMDREGVLVQAQVTRTGKTGGDAPRRFAEYRYAGVAGRVLLSGSDPSLAIGDPIEVRYLPADPRTNWAVGHAPVGPPLPAMAAVLLSFWLGAVLVVAGVRRQWRLLSEGRAAVGRVTAVKRSKDSGGRTTYRAEYEFTLLSGATRRIWSGAGKATAEGSSAPLLYDPENPKRLCRYPMSLVKISRD